MTVDAPLIYLDTNIVSDLATGKLSATKIVNLCGNPKSIFAFSQYSVWEAIRGEKPKNIAARALVIDRLARAWVPDPIWQRDMELIRFLKSSARISPGATTIFSTLQELIENQPGLNASMGHINYTVSYMACWKLSRANDESAIDIAFQRLELVRKELAATTQDISPVELNLLLFKAVVDRYDLSDCDPTAMMCKVATSSNAEINVECPSKEIEELLSEFRTSGKLKNNPSNSFDLFHLWTALPSCDYFVTCDSDAIEAVRYVKVRSQHKIAQPINPNAN